MFCTAAQQRAHVSAAIHTVTTTHTNTPKVTPSLLVYVSHCSLSKKYSVW